MSEPPGPDAARQGPLDPAEGGGIPELPVRLGEFRIIREIGRGGMGIVYQAEQESPRRPVALKVLPFQASTDRRRIERLQAEARAAGSLEHENIVPIHGLHEERGIHFLVTQLIDGRGLDTVIRALHAALVRAADPAGESPSGPVDRLSSSLALALLDPSTSGNPDRLDPIPAVRPDAETVSVMAAPPSSSEARIRDLCREGLPASHYRSVARLGIQTADALAFAHDRGVLHRDIKPSNLLLDVQGKVWVADFALARASGAGDPTEPDELVGTSRYLAPERLVGQTTSQSDIYSLGLTLKEMALFDSPAALVPRRGEGRRLASRLEAIVLKASAWDPQLRHASARELASDLRKLLRGGRPLPAIADRPRPRRWLIAAASALLLLAAGVGLLVPSLATQVVLKPCNVILADFDGDQRIDIAAPGYSSTDDSRPSSVFIFHQQGGGVFRPPIRVPSGTLPLGLAAADLDRDGHPDLVVSNRNSRDIHVLLGDVPQGFRKQRPVGLESPPIGIAPGDLDLDGLPDVAVVTFQSEVIELLRNRGGGAFEREPAVRTGAGPSKIKCLDMDGDQKADLITSNPWSRSVSVLVNRGHWSFERTDYPLGMVPWGFDTADVNGDGRPDVEVAMTSASEAFIGIYRNQGAGLLGAVDAHRVEFAVGAVVGGDFNGDRWPDLVAAGGESFVCFLANRGDGTFGDPVSVGGAEKPGMIAAADLNGDGLLDLALTSVAAEGRITTLLGDGKGSFRPGPSLELRYRRFPWDAP